MDSSPPTAIKVRLSNVTSSSVPDRGAQLARQIYDERPAPAKHTKHHPLIRIFGSTPAGQKCCFNIWGAWPYMYVPVPDSLKSKLDPKEVKAFAYQLHKSLDYALTTSTSYANHAHDPLRVATNIRSVQLIKAVPFYGFHVGYSYYFKISFVYPSVIARAAQLLLAGAVMGVKFQPHEAHIPHVLQFLADYDLYGCGWLNVDLSVPTSLRFKEPLPDIEDVHSQSLLQISLNAKANPSPSSQALDDPSDRLLFFEQNVPAQLTSTNPRFSRCQIEIDLHVSSLPKRPAPRNLHTTFSEVHNPNSDSAVLVPSLRAYWDDERRRRKARGQPEDIPPVESVLGGRREESSLNNRWHTEAESRREIRKRAAAEQMGQTTAAFEDFGHEVGEVGVMTAFEAVEGLWLRQDWKWRRALPTGNQKDQEDAELTALIDLDPSETNIQVKVDEYVVSTQRAIGLPANGSDASSASESEDDPEAESSEPIKADIVLASPSSKLDGPSYATTPKTLIDSPRGKLATQIASSKRNLRWSIKRRQPLSPHSSDSGLTTGTFTPPTTPSKRRVMDEFNPFATPGSRSPSRRKALQGISPPSAKVKSDWALVSATPKESPPKFRNTASMSAPSLPAKQSLVEATVEETSKQYKTIILSSAPEDDDKEIPTEHEWVMTQKAPVTDRSPLRSVNKHRTSTPGDRSKTTWSFMAPPTKAYIIATVKPSMIHRIPFYSSDIDVPERSREYAGKVFRLGGGSSRFLNPFSCPTSSTSQVTEPCSVKIWQFVASAPARKTVAEWSIANPLRCDVARTRSLWQTQFQGPTQATVSTQEASIALRDKQHMTILAIEVHVNCRKNKRGNTYLNPDARHDEIQAIAFCFQSEDNSVPDTGTRAGYHTGLIAVRSPALTTCHASLQVPVQLVLDELDIINTLVDLVRDLDPECIAGWELQKASWGYVQARSELLDMRLSDDIGRILTPSTRSNQTNSSYDEQHTTTLKVAGRHVLNIWRIMRGEKALTSYSFENVAFHVLNQRLPHYNGGVLTEWFLSADPSKVVKSLRHILTRATASLEILEDAEVMTRNAEFARCFGIDFYSVISRGSQFKVESFMMRMAKPESFLLISPSREQVGSQNAAECLALVMEPESALYNDPVVVLDFQSLYPSIMIGYNYSFDTCLGRVQKYRGVDKLGVTQYSPAANMISLLEHNINVSPNGLLFTRTDIRKGLIGKVLREILDTRVMIKNAMKAARGDRFLTRLLHARQLSLKFVANVTYGYIGASYSGRMPCVEIADAIVQTGRETLEKAIEMIHSNPKWKARVVYGDTDSLFVMFPGRTKADAFVLGNEIADCVTASNPKPLKLKFEKVYLPCVLMAKKRYVGFKYEHPEDLVPTFDAKGIETVRRDGSGVERQALEVALKLLFRTKDLTQVKDYCIQSFFKLYEASVSPLDCIIAKEVKLGTYAVNRAPPPGVMVAAEMMLNDENAEPQYAERVAYIITQGEPGRTQAQTSRSPLALLNDPHAMINAEYYCERMVKVLNRVFNLIGVDVEQWLKNMPKPVRPSIHTYKRTEATQRRAPSRIDSHFRNRTCCVCGRESVLVVCKTCQGSERISHTLCTLQARLHTAQIRARDLHQICASCTNSPPSEAIECDSIDCRVMYARCKAEAGLRQLDGITDVIDTLSRGHTIDW